jgi:hypothetical protein
MQGLFAALLALALGQAAPGRTSNTLTLAEGAAGPKATVADVAWLTGHWRGEGLGGTVDEVYSDPAGGAIVGHFRLVRAGKPVFYEIITILEHHGTLELRLKHVNPDMTGWEEKNDFVTFKLAKLEPGAAYFSGLTFKRVGDDTLETYLALRDRTTNVVSEEKFVYKRMKSR